MLQMWESRYHICTIVQHQTDHQPIGLLNIQSQENFLSIGGKTLGGPHFVELKLKTRSHS